jgi:hypothetical protein
MTIYKIQPSTDVDKAGLAFTEELDGKSYFFEGKAQANWQELTLSWNEHDRDISKLEKQDFTLIIGAGVNIVLNDKAKVALESVFNTDVEYLPVNVEGDADSYYLLNVLNVLENALALDKCEFRIRRNGEVGAVKNAVFDEANSPDNRIFIAPQKTTTAMFKGELLKELCIEHGLTGLEFHAAQVSNS